MSRRTEQLSLTEIDLGQLAFLVGSRLNEVVLEALQARGFEGVRPSHGYVIQHLLAGEPTVTELARRMGVTQQGASKAVGELRELGYVEEVATDDARMRRLRLSPRGQELVHETRAHRARLERQLEKKVGEKSLRVAHQSLAALLDLLGGIEAVQQRRVREPDTRARKSR